MGDFYRPGGGGSGDGPPSIPRAAQNAMYHFQGNRNEGRPARPAQRTQPQRNVRNGMPRNQPRNGRTNYYRRPPHASERPLLTQQHNDSDLQAFRDPDAVDKFRDPADLTDSEEDDMSESDDSLDMLRLPPAKRAKTTAVKPHTSSPPKWSNPDPYTALPPGAEAIGIGFDIIKKVRKAKNADAANQKEQDFKLNDDFISFDVDPVDPVDPDETEDDPDLVADAPTGPKADRLGKRKRGYEDAVPRPPTGYTSGHDNTVLPEWLPKNPDESTPWYIPCRPEDTASMALHKEIIDFYEWVRPKDYDVEVREDVINRLSLAFNRIEPGEIKPFGSFAAGLYLPIGDMDLVFLQRTFRPNTRGQNGLPEKPKRKLMDKFAKLLQDQQIARPGSVLVIFFAKVPIIKFVDALSGLKVDLSFNNDTGVVANETVGNWKAKHAAMPILVSIVKQFLMIRGLNDVAVGGLGGFSVICLVTSLIQHMPGIGPSTNLGQLLVEFFNLYGNILDYENVAIRLDPPGYLDKNSYKPLLYNDEKRGRLTIIDPNRPENNISGGSRLIQHILSAFSAAHQTLQSHLTVFSEGTIDGTSFSFLRDLVGGNFDAYTVQRRALQDLYFGMTGQDASEPVIRKVPLPVEGTARKVSRTEVVVPVRSGGEIRKGSLSTTKRVVKRGQVSSVDGVADSDESDRDGDVGKSVSTVQSDKRAVRMKRCLPDLAKTIGSSINVKRALKLSGCKTEESLEEFLVVSERHRSQAKPGFKQ